jgi:hypothetical protein
VPKRSGLKVVCFGGSYAVLIPLVWRIVFGMRGYWREAARLLIRQRKSHTCNVGWCASCRVWRVEWLPYGCTSSLVVTRRGGVQVEWSVVQHEMQLDADKCSSFDSVRKAPSLRQSAGATQASKRFCYHFICRRRSGVGGVCGGTFGGWSRISSLVV